MKVGAVAWECRPYASVAEYLAHAEQALALTEGCDLAVWPEQTTLGLLDDRLEFLGSDAVSYLGGQFEDVRQGLRHLVQGSGQDVLTGTHFVPTEFGVENRPLWLTDSGEAWELPGKNVLTQYEIHDWQMAPGNGLGLVGQVGAAVCYDSEFPASGRALAEEGAFVLAVPYFTQDRFGYQRILWCGRARAVELQLYVVQAGLVGGLGREPVPSTYGQAAILTPSLDGFPADATLAATSPGVEGAAIAELDLEYLAGARKSGDVRNWNDRDRGDWRVTFRE
ncbi:MAG: nitrilase-related carbon-nitrogen hydrolase [Fimbriimonadaceae bacterium]